MGDSPDVSGRIPERYRRGPANCISAETRIEQRPALTLPNDECNEGCDGRGVS
jgi:hypothetical protein